MVGRKPTESSAALSRALRTSTEPFVRRRRRAAALSLTAMAALTPVAAYQMAIVRHLPDPPGRWIDSDRAAPTTISIGLAIAADKTVDEVVARADAAMYRAKRAGRDGFSLSTIDANHQRA